jgi:hypothetical protein
VQFLHDRYNIAQVFDYVLAYHGVKPAVFKRIRENVEVPHHVGIYTWVYVESDRARDLTIAGTDVKYRVPSTEYRVVLQLGTRYSVLLTEHGR